LRKEEKEGEKGRRGEGAMRRKWDNLAIRQYTTYYLALFKFLIINTIIPNLAGLYVYRIIM